MECSTELGKSVLAEGGLFLKEALVVKPDGESPRHGAVAEFKRELNKGHARAAAVGFSPVGPGVISKHWPGARR